MPRLALPLLLAAGAPFALRAQDASPTELRIERELTLRSGSPWQMEWSSDGRTIASRGSLRDVVLVDTATGATRELDVIIVTLSDRAVVVRLRD